MSQAGQPGQAKPPVPALYSWSEVWTAVVTRPSVKTFSELLRDPAATPRRGFIWLYIVGCAFAFLIGFMFVHDPDLSQVLPPGMTMDDFVNSMALSLVCAVPLMGAISLGGAMLMAGIIHIIAERMQPSTPSEKRYPALFYALAAISAPLTVLGILLQLIQFGTTSPVVQALLPIIILGLTLYQLILMGLAVQAVYGITQRKAALAVGLPMLAAMVVLTLLTGF